MYFQRHTHDSVPSHHVPPQTRKTPGSTAMSLSGSPQTMVYVVDAVLRRICPKRHIARWPHQLAFGLCTTILSVPVVHHQNVVVVGPGSRQTLGYPEPGCKSRMVGLYDMPIHRSYPTRKPIVARHVVVKDPTEPICSEVCADCACGQWAPQVFLYYVPLLTTWRSRRTTPEKCMVCPLQWVPAARHQS